MDSRNLYENSPLSELLGVSGNHEPSMRKLTLAIAGILLVLVGAQLWRSRNDSEITPATPIPAPANIASSLSQHGSEQLGNQAAQAILSEDVVRLTHSLAEALQVLLPRVDAGDYDALHSLSLAMKECSAFSERGPAAYDAFVKDKRVLNNPHRKALVSKKFLYCQQGGSLLPKAQAVAASYYAHEASAIQQGSPRALVIGHVSRSDIGQIAPQFATKKAFDDALALASETGTPASRTQIAMVRLSSLNEPEVRAIDREAANAGIEDISELHTAATQLYGCKVGRYCGRGSDVLESACLFEGRCEGVSVETYIREDRFSPSQVALIDRYLSYLDSGK